MSFEYGQRQRKRVTHIPVTVLQKHCGFGTAVIGHGTAMVVCACGWAHTLAGTQVNAPQSEREFWLDHLTDVTLKIQGYAVEP